MKAKILLLLLKNACKFNTDKIIYVSVDNKLIPCTRISSHNDKIVIGTRKGAGYDRRRNIRTL